MCFNYFWSWLSANATNVIALTALAATFYQAYISRKHNKLSVKPYLTTWNTTTPEGYSILAIINNGVGPAHIKSFGIFVDGQKMIGENTEPHIKCLNIIFPDYLFSWYGSYLGIDYMMPSNEQKDLIAIKFTDTKVPSQLEMQHRTKRVQIVIEYESIYQEKFKYDSASEARKQLS